MRVISSNKETRQEPSRGLAVRDSVNIDELKKKYMRDVEDGKVDTKPFDPAESQSAEDLMSATSFTDFFDLEGEVVITEDAPDEALSNLTNIMMDSSDEVFTKAEEQRTVIEEEDENEKMSHYQEDKYTINDDANLSNEYTKKSESLIKKIKQDDKAAKQIFIGLDKDEHGNFLKKDDEQDPYAPKKYQQSHSWSKPSSHTSSTSTSKPVESFSRTDDPEAIKRKQSQYAHAADTVRNFVGGGPKKQKKKKEVSRFGKKRWSFKGMVASVKQWFRSEDAALLCKVGTMMCLELSLAIITKKYEFDNTGQLVAFLGMMLGIFYISREIMSEGYDPRRMSFL
ncbi:hypothetical protein ACQKJG_18870 [Priestia megaterium]|uniref:hypothetical protein n=1 Tax=Priestia megaterium TaxID=1404 RepID=UPI003D04F265